MTTQENPTFTETNLSALDLECLKMTELWLESKRIDGGFPKDAKIERIKFTHTDDKTIVWITLSTGTDTHLKIHHRPITIDMAIE